MGDLLGKRLIRKKYKEFQRKLIFQNINELPAFTKVKWNLNIGKQRCIEFKTHVC